MDTERTFFIRPDDASRVGYLPWSQIGFESLDEAVTAAKELLVEFPSTKWAQVVSLWNPKTNETIGFYVITDETT